MRSVANNKIPLYIFSRERDNHWLFINGSSARVIFMKLVRYFVAIVLSLSALAHPVQAAEEPPWYDIELILFKQGSSGGAATEVWSEDPGSPDWSDTVTLLPPADAPLQPYALLPSSSWRLAAQFDALQRTRGAMEPLYHQAWRQPVATNAGAEAIYLGPGPQHSDAGPLPLFEGLIRISVNRYLHVDLDILLRGANSALPPASPDALPSPTRGSIRFQASRRMRSGELHYIDHPRLGALILISRVELPEPKTETAAEPAVTDAVAPPAEPIPPVTETASPAPN